MGANNISSTGTITAGTFVGSFNGEAATVTNGVYLSGQKDITGNKTFSGNNTFSGNSNVFQNGLTIQNGLTVNKLIIRAL